MLTLVIALFWASGCAGRMNTDLLQARIRQQEAQLAESQMQIAKTKSELKHSRQEADRLKSELNQGGGPEIGTVTATTVRKVRINPLASGGLNKDQLPGDDMIVVQFAPVDVENQPVKTAGELEIVLIDPQLPARDQEIGQWMVSADKCQDYWTRGITGSGYQFTLPLSQQPAHADLVVQLKFTTADSRELLTSQKIKVNVAPANIAAAKNRQLVKRVPRVQMIDDINDPPPPVGDQASVGADNDDAGWEEEEQLIPAKPIPAKKPGRVILHSSSATEWSDATGSVLR